VKKIRGKKQSLDAAKNKVFAVGKNKTRAVLKTKLAVNNKA
jgi:hypothetical protein